MYTGEFKNGARYKTVHGEGLITYIGALHGIHYYIDVDGDMDGWSDEKLRNWIKEEIKTPKTITGYVNINTYKDGDDAYGLYSTRQEADDNNSDGEERTSCVKVTITYTECQFDE